MKPYKNSSGKSGVVAYEIGKDYIKVKFVDGPIYLYTWKSTGELNVEHMKKLATSGSGLSTFISVSIRGNYESKEISN